MYNRLDMSIVTKVLECNSFTGLPIQFQISILR